VVVLVAAIAFVCACSGGGTDDQQAGSGSQEGAAASTVPEPGGPASVERFCGEVEQFARDVEVAVGADDAGVEELQRRAQGFSQQAVELYTIVVSEPALAGRLQGCSERAAQVQQELAASLIGSSPAQSGDEATG